MFIWTYAHTCYCLFSLFTSCILDLSLGLFYFFLKCISFSANLLEETHFVCLNISLAGCRLLDLKKNHQGSNFTVFWLILWLFKVLLFVSCCFYFKTTCLFSFITFETFFLLLVFWILTMIYLGVASF